jgi:hypothetical protein
MRSTSPATAFEKLAQVPDAAVRVLLRIEGIVDASRASRA